MKNKVSDEAVLPLLMNYTKSTKIQKADNLPPLTYNTAWQMLEIDMRIVGTKSLKRTFTRKANGCDVPDNKNEIDDSKNVI